MALPETVRVKLSSEAADFVSLTPVVAQDMRIEELLEQILGKVGTDLERVREVLRRGSLVSGGTRYRWTAVEAAAEEVSARVARMPGPEPGRVFAAERTVRLVLHGGGARLELRREAAEKRRLLHRKSFLAAVEEACGTPVYGRYLYAERADVYVGVIEAAALVSEAAELLAYPALAARVRAMRVERVEWVVGR
jgi:hypothetical protein